MGSWKKWSARLPAEVEVEAWFANSPDAVCIVAGSVSGNLECIDFDAHGELFPKWKDSIAPEVFERLVVERTPSGGFHVLYRSDTSVPGNRKLAQGMRAGKKTTLIETRAEGGLFLCAPTEGYELIQGEFTRLAVLGQEARESLLVSAEALNECMDEVPVKSPTQGENLAFLLKPGDDWCARGDIRPILAAHGWNYLGTKQDGNELWQRPGKTGDGNSATFNGSVFCVFSTNAAPFEAKGYSKFQVYAILEHNGDFTAAAKALLEMGYGRADDPSTGVDISGILAASSTGEVDAEEHDGALDDPGVIPESYFEVPGFVSDLMNFTLRTSYYPNKALAFAGAMAMLSHLTGRRYKDQRGGRFNLYLLALAKSGTGKEHPRSVNIDLATVTGIVGEFGDTFASGEGLEDSLLISPAMIYQVDEVDYLFNTVKVKDVRAEQINSMLLKLYSESKTTHIMRKKAIQRGQPSPGSVIVQPHLTVFGTATPKFFYQSLTERTMENGLLARCIILEAGERGDAGNPHEEDYPEAILETIQA
ncbi:MAG: bifunctional DNA primase/polymerase, partial [Kiritimatiellae bacterium]|nr:bifunctional DNA primase/polymerase [Kiritimatiellia bacterium]